MIDAVNEWCVNNQMSIIVNKTKVMHVRNKPIGLNLDFRVF